MCLQHIYFTSSFSSSCFGQSNVEKWAEIDVQSKKGREQKTVGRKIARYHESGLFRDLIDGVKKLIDLLTTQP